MRGFTLLELMIVVAIIGILVSLALPNLIAYRTKAANTAAMSDVKHLALTEMSFYDDSQQYMEFTLADANAQGVIAKTFVNGTNSFQFRFVLSSNVQAIANVDSGGGSAIVAARCINGDRIVAMEIERDNTLRYFLSTTTPLDTTLVPASTSAHDLVTWTKW